MITADKTAIQKTTSLDKVRLKNLKELRNSIIPKINIKLLYLLFIPTFS
ncbi:hypothetical protein TCEA9_09550 [Thermobrachium celere]|nr:hypothetical protein TCEA9_09550 [Thermobrachium celere]